MLKKNKQPIFKEAPFARRMQNIDSEDSSDDEKIDPRVDQL